MVKQILSFLRWQLARFKWDDYLWFIGCGMVGWGFSKNDLVMYLGIAIITGILLSSMIKSQWQRWKEERKELLETIKDSK